MLLCLFSCLWCLTLYFSPIHALCALPDSLFQISERREGSFIAVLCGINMITSRTMRVIWNVYSVMHSSPYLRYYLWEFNNNCIQPVGRIGEDNFPQFFTPVFSFRLVTRSFQNFEFSLDVKENILLCLLCLLTVVYTMFGVNREIFKKIKGPAQKINFFRSKMARLTLPNSDRFYNKVAVTSSPTRKRKYKLS